MASPVNRDRALSFDTVAAQYAAARPGYPPALFDAVEEFAGRPLAGADVLDCGAGTGIATRQLRGRGARAVALEPGAGMAAQLRRTGPEIPLVRGEGDRLPFAADSFDVIAYAQSWHWTDPSRSVPEALRVLRPHGLLALWWNQIDLRVPWVAQEQDRLAPFAHGFPPTVAESFAPFPVRVSTREFTWSRRISVDEHIRNLETHSHFVVMDPVRRAELLDADRAALERLFPGGELDEPYRCGLTAVRPLP
ncbi:MULTISPECIES: class I SAM-dependent methyltransferase [Streptomyces]|uniref:Class I SAM-dependent methyltransferase n=1 Tax=Streptomyces sudanensis TaxID=436397 RepID=A0ABY4T8B9_9ACTN|nr:MULTISPECIES: class I SAM-dependent methyltransferase [Streptomyces]MCP9956205.1 class I SAM-dependent methyltransferase [Streptomyces sudanensis]MCP9985413.1 class I SAM-dependent methyltransferase [Streptomyces sudanensis]MCQ0003160.1 class I SAM-dependent methyltransferase [Streptomyces sudanensis]URN14636.1 class I SAM-dependent methyltransferase [Streptomyces sudanensis]